MYVCTCINAACCQLLSMIVVDYCRPLLSVAYIGTEWPTPSNTHTQNTHTHTHTPIIIGRYCTEFYNGLSLILRSQQALILAVKVP